MNNDIKIAVLEEQVRGIREQNKAQFDSTKSMFDNTQSMISKLFEEMDELKRAMSKGSGVFAASLTFAGVIGFAISIVVQWLFFSKNH